MSIARRVATALAPMTMTMPGPLVKRSDHLGFRAGRTCRDNIADVMLERGVPEHIRHRTTERR